MALTTKQSLENLYKEVSVHYNTGTLDDFSKYMSNERNRLRLYTALQHSKIDYGTWEEFNNALGYTPKEEYNPYLTPSQKKMVESIKYGNEVYQGLLGKNNKAKENQEASSEQVDPASTTAEAESASAPAAQPKTITPNASETETQPEATENVWNDSVQQKASAQPVQQEERIQNPFKNYSTLEDAPQSVKDKYATNPVASMESQPASETFETQQDIEKEYKRIEDRANELNAKSEELKARAMKASTQEEFDAINAESEILNADVEQLNKDSEAYNKNVEAYGNGIARGSEEYTSNRRGWSRKDDEKIIELMEKEDNLRKKSTPELQYGEETEFGESERKYLRDAVKVREEIEKECMRITGISNPKDAYKQYMNYINDNLVKSVSPEIERQIKGIQEIAPSVENAFKNELAKHTKIGLGIDPMASSAGAMNAAIQTQTGAEELAVETATLLLEEARQTILNYNTTKGQRSHTGFGWDVAHFGANASRGFGQKVSDISTWDFGITDMMKATTLLDIARKKENGVQLSDAEQKCLDAAALNLYVMASVETGLGFQAGEVTAESLPFMLDMLINPVAAQGNGLANIVFRTMRAGIKRGTYKISKKMAQKMALDIVKQEASNIGRGAAMAVDPMQIMTTTAGIEQRATGNAYGYFDENGQYRFEAFKDRMSIPEAVAKGFLTQVFENESEFAGDTMLDGISDIFGEYLKKAGGKVVGKLHLGKIGEPIKRHAPHSFERAYQYLSAIPNKGWYANVKQIKERAHVSGLFGETNEEIWGGIENAMIGEQDISEVLSADNYGDTFITMLPMQVMFGAVGLGGYAVQKGKARRDVNNARNSIYTVFSEGRKGNEFGNADMIISALESNLDNPDKDFDYGKFVIDLAKKDGLNPSQQAAIVNYGIALQYYKGLDGAERLNSQRNLNRMVINSAYEKGHGITDDAERLNESGILYNDSRNIIPFIVDKEFEEAVSLADNGYFGEALVRLNKSKKNTPQKQRALENYIESLAIRKGINDGIDEEAQQKVNNFALSLVPKTNPEGNIVTARYQNEDVNVTSDPGAIGTDGAVTILHSDGTIEQVSGSDIYMAEAKSASSLVDNYAQQTMSEAEAQKKSVSGQMDAPKVGDKFMRNGKEFTVTNISASKSENPFNKKVNYYYEATNGEETKIFSLNQIVNNPARESFWNPVNEERIRERNRFFLDNDRGDEAESQEQTEEPQSVETPESQEPEGAIQRSPEFERLLNDESVTLADGTVIKMDLATRDEETATARYGITHGNEETQYGKYTDAEIEAMLHPAPAPEQNGGESTGSGDGTGTGSNEGGTQSPSPEDVAKAEEAERKRIEARQQKFLKDLDSCTTIEQVDRLVDEINGENIPFTAAMTNAVENKKNELKPKNEDEIPQEVLDKQAEWENAKNDWYAKRINMSIDDRLAEVRAAGFSPETGDETVIALFAVAEGFRVEPSEMQKEIGDNWRDLGLLQFVKNGGPTIQQVAHNAFENANGYSRNGVDVQEVRNQIIDALKQCTKRKSASTYAIEDLEQMAHIGDQWREEESPLYLYQYQQAVEKKEREERQTEEDAFDEINKGIADGMTDEIQKQIDSEIYDEEQEKAYQEAASQIYSQFQDSGYAQDNIAYPSDEQVQFIFKYLDTIMDTASAAKIKEFVGNTINDDIANDIFNAWQALHNSDEKFGNAEEHKDGDVVVESREKVDGETVVKLSSYRETKDGKVKKITTHGGVKVSIENLLYDESTMDFVDGLRKDGAKEMWVSTIVIKDNGEVYADVTVAGGHGSYERVKINPNAPAKLGEAKNEDWNPMDVNPNGEEKPSDEGNNPTDSSVNGKEKSQTEIAREFINELCNLFGKGKKPSFEKAKEACKKYAPAFIKIKRYVDFLNYQDLSKLGKDKERVEELLKLANDDWRYWSNDLEMAYEGATGQAGAGAVWEKGETDDEIGESHNAYNSIIMTMDSYSFLKDNELKLAELLGLDLSVFDEKKSEPEQPASNNEPSSSNTEEKPEQPSQPTHTQSSHPTQGGSTRQRPTSRRPKTPSRGASNAEWRSYYEQIYKDKNGNTDKAKVDKAMRMHELTNKKKISLANRLGFHGDSINKSNLTKEEVTELLNLGMDLSKDYLDYGDVHYNEFFEDMVHDFGDNIRPYVARIYGMLAYDTETSEDIQSKMSSPADIKKYDMYQPIADEQTYEDNAYEAEHERNKDVTNAEELQNMLDEFDEKLNSGTLNWRDEAVYRGWYNADADILDGLENNPNDNNNNNNDNEEGTGEQPVSSGNGGRDNGSDEAEPTNEPSGDGGRTVSGTASESGNEPRPDGGSGKSGGQHTGSGTSKSGRDKNDESESGLGEGDNESARESGENTPTDDTRADAEAGPDGELDIEGTDNRKPSKPSREQSKEVGDALKNGDEKVPYHAKSQGMSLNSVIPTAAAQQTYDCLDEFDDIDEYVRVKLGYKTKEEMFEHLAAEQVDGVAMSISAMEKGYSMVIGDQTGLGKGRQAASIIRYARKLGKTPIFFTQKPNLFTDLYRDMTDIGSEGLRPLIINASKSNIVVGGELVSEQVFNDDGTPALDEDGAPIFEEEWKGGSVVYKHNKKDVAKFLKDGVLPKGYDYVLVTYSQIQGTSENYEKRKKALLTLAKDNIVVMDESHTAAGESNTGEYMQDIVRDASGITFLSATYAKNPSCMPMYALRSVISDANLTQKQLIKAIQKGGIPMQEIMSQAFTASGAMVRRERDMAGVKVDWKPMEVDPNIQRAKYDSVIEVFRRITDFQATYIIPRLKDIRDSAPDGTRVFWVNNKARLYNLVNQMTTAIKVESVISEAKEALARGEKPYISLADTNTNLLNDFFEVGENIDKYDISIILKRCIEKTFDYLVKEYDEEGVLISEERPRLDIDAMDDAAQDEYYALLDEIDNLVTDLPLSPIDEIRTALEADGYKVGEITGRGQYVTTSEDGQHKFENRTAKDRNSLVNGFNNGDIDCLILNKAGSTGLSIHASKKFKDQRPRHHITLQPQADTNDEAQMRGRGDRTGQLQHCIYTYIMSHIPAENRIMMMLKKKLASLDANTTSSSKTKFNEVDTVDFGNKYGSQVIVDVLKENIDWYDNMDDPFGWRKKASVSEDENAFDEIKDKYVAKEMDYDKAMKRVGMLTTDEQTEFYDQVIERYEQLINTLDATGMNDLEIKDMPLDARTLQITEYVRGENPGGQNVFADSAYIEEVECNSLNKPMTQQEVKNAILNSLNGKSEEEYRNGLLKSLEDYYNGEVEKIDKNYESSVDAKFDTVKKRIDKKRKSDEEKFAKDNTKGRKWTEEEYESELKKAKDDIEKSAGEQRTIAQNKLKNKVSSIRLGLSGLKVGHYYNIEVSSKSGNTQYYEGVLTGFKLSDNYSDKASFLRFSLNNGQRILDLPFSQKTGVLNMVSQEANAGSMLGGGGNYGTDVTNKWESMLGNSFDKREKRHIITGNLLTAIAQAGEVKGQIITFTTEDGRVRRGILLPKNTNLKQFGKAVPLSDAYPELNKWHESGWTLTTADGKITFKFQPRAKSRWSLPRDWRFEIKKSANNEILHDEELITILRGMYSSDDMAESCTGETKQTYQFDFDNAVTTNNGRESNTLKDLVELLTKKYGMQYNQDLNFNPESQENAIKDIKRENAYKASDVKHYFYDWIDQAGINTTNEEMRDLANIVFPIAEKLGLEVKFGDTDSKDTGGYYQIKKNKIELKYNFFAYQQDPRYRAEVMLHEFIHSVTAYAIYVRQGHIKGVTLNPELEKATDELIATYKAIKNMKELKGMYGLTDEHEMVAELANPEWRNALSRVNLFERVIRAVSNVIRNLFSQFMPHRDESALERVESCLKRMIENFDEDTYKKAQEYAANSDHFADKLNQDKLKHINIPKELGEKTEKLITPFKSESESAFKKRVANFKEDLSRAYTLDSANGIEYYLKDKDGEDMVEHWRRESDFNITMRQFGNLGYHAGNLGKSEYFGNMAGFGRSTGHFGTGTYFFGSEGQADNYANAYGMSTDERPVHAVDFGRYNLWRPTGAESGRYVHDFLKKVNTYFSRDINAVQDLDELKKVRKEFKDAYDDMYEDEHFNADNARKLTDILAKVIGKSAAERELEAGFKEDVDTASVDEIKRYMHNISMIMEDWSTEKEVERYYNFIHGDFWRASQIIGVDINDLKDAYNDVRREYIGRTAFNKEDSAMDSPSTALMKKLGFEGVDVRGIPELDNSTYGSVIYDLDKDDVRFQRMTNSIDNASDKPADIVSAVEQMGSELGFKAKVVDSLDDIPNVHARRMLGNRQARGYYDISTGTVYAYLPNIGNVNEAKKFMLHEILGHKGLRQLFGENEYDAQMIHIYEDLLPKEYKKQVLNKMLNIGRNNAKQGEKFYKRSVLAEAMDEWLAERAEMFEGQPSFFDKVRAVFRNIVSALGFNLELNDNDIDYMMWRSYQTFKENGTRTFADGIRDWAMRQRYGIGTYETEFDPNDPNGRGPNGGIRFKSRRNITSSMNAAYNSAIKNGDEKKANDLVEQAAVAEGYAVDGNGKPIVVYHGTPHFGFTAFNSARKSGAIFAVDKRNVSANYGGDSNYAGVRRINKKIVDSDKPKDIIENARNAFSQDWRFATDEERLSVIESVEKNAKEINKKLDELEVDVPEDIADDVAWVRNIIYDAELLRKNGNEGDEASNVLINDFEKFNESRDAIREYPHYDKLSEEQIKYLSYLKGYHVGDVAVDAGMSMAKAFKSEPIATVTGDSFLTMDELKENISRTKNIGSYQMFVHLGENPLEIDCKDRNWYSIDFNGKVSSTDEIVEWAKENGYTSVIFKNIYDYGDKANVYAVFGSDQLKSADPVTYDDNGNVIPLEDRFDSNSKDIRFQRMQAPSTPANQSVAGREYLKGVEGFANAVKEAYHDGLRSLRILQEALVKHSGMPLEDYQNVYHAALFLPRVNKAEWEAYMMKYVEPCLDAVSDICGNLTWQEKLKGKIHIAKFNKYRQKASQAKKTQLELEHYLNAVHGIERNEVFAKRDAEKQSSEEFDGQIEAAMAAGNQQLASDLEQQKQDRYNELYEKFRKRDYSGLTSIFGLPTDPDDIPLTEIEQRAQDYADDFEKSVGKQRCDNLWNALENMRSFIIDKEWKSGCISRELRDQLNTMFKHYVPLRDFRDGTAEDAYDYSLSEGITTQTVIEHAEGRKTEAGDIIANLMNMAHSAINQCNRNMANRALLRLAQDHRSPLLTVSREWYQKGADGKWYPVAPFDPMNNNDPIDESKMTPEQMADAYSNFEEYMRSEMEKNPRQIMEHSAALQLGLPIQKAQHRIEHQVFAFVDGKKYVVSLNSNPKATMALNGTLMQVENSKIIQALAIPARFIGRAVTTFNPEFMFSNFQRDLVASTETLAAKYGREYTVKYIENVGLIMPLFGNLGRIKRRDRRGISKLYDKYKKGTLDPNNKIEAYFKEFIDNGGETGFSQVLSVDDYESIIHKRIGVGHSYDSKSKLSKAVAKARDIKDDIESPFDWIFDGVDEANRKIENICRFAAYMTSREMKRSKLQAVDDAAEASVNFNRKGSGAFGNALFRSLIMFFNASIQGVSQMLKLMGSSSPHHNRARAIFIGFNMVAGYLMTSLNLLIGDDGDDDDDLDNTYLRISDFRRRNSVNLLVGDGALRYDLSHEDAAFYGLGCIAAEYTFGYGHKDSEEIAEDIIGQLGQLLPADVASNELSEGKAISQVFKGSMISGAKPMIEAYLLNEDFAGRKINNQRDDDTFADNSHRPEYMRTTRNTNETLNSAIRFMSESMGGTRDDRAWYEEKLGNFAPNADNWGHVLSGYLGGPYQFIDGATNTIAYFVHSLSGDDVSDRELSRNIPIVRRMYTGASSDWSKNRAYKAEFDYYKTFIERTESAMGQIKRDKRDDYFSRHPDEPSEKTRLKWQKEKTYYKYYLAWEKDKDNLKKKYEKAVKKANEAYRTGSTKEYIDAQAEVAEIRKKAVLKFRKIEEED